MLNETDGTIALDLDGIKQQVSQGCEGRRDTVLWDDLSAHVNTSKAKGEPRGSSASRSVFRVFGFGISNGPG